MFGRHFQRVLEGPGGSFSSTMSMKMKVHLLCSGLLHKSFLGSKWASKWRPTWPQNFVQKLANCCSVFGANVRSPEASKKATKVVSKSGHFFTRFSRKTCPQIGSPKRPGKAPTIHTKIVLVTEPWESQEPKSGQTPKSI